MSMRTSLSRSVVPLLSALCCGASILAGCGASPPAEAAQPNSTPASTTPAPRGRYEVHEWGLVDVARDGSVELAAGPGQATLAAPQPAPGGPLTPPQTLPQPHPPAATRKPVLYFHLLEGEVQLSVGATMSYGSMLERFPAAPFSGPSVTWETVQLVSRACGSTEYPSEGSPGCQGIPDDYCEAAELALYEARDASCLVVDGRDYNHLFYRGGGRGLSLPVSVSRTDTTTTLTNSSAYAIPFALLVTTTPPAAGDLRRADPATPAGAVSVRRFGRVPAGTSANVNEAISVEAAVAALRAELGLLGLTSAETQAFMNAWERAVLRAPNVDAAVLYLLPPELVDTVSTLSLTPAPERTQRAMMVRVEL